MFVDSLYINKELLAKTPVLRCTKKIKTQATIKHKQT